MRTKDQQKLNEILMAIERLCRVNGYSPSQRDIAKEVDMTPSCVCRYIRKLKQDGQIYQSPTGRNIITHSYKELVCRCNVAPLFKTHLYGKTGNRITDMVVLPKRRYGDENHIVLHITDASLEFYGFYNGDYLIFRKQDTAKEDAIILADINGEIHLAKKKNKNIEFIRRDEDAYELKFRTEKFKIYAVAVKLIQEKIL